MKQNTDPSTLPRYRIQPGYVYLAAEPTRISVVLGSCIAVSLFDRRRQKGGMNHFCYPKPPPTTDPTALYGTSSTAALIRMFQSGGSRSTDLEAMIFGGAILKGSEKEHVGKENAAAARHILRKAGIAVAGEDIGGHKGRKVIFDSATGETIVYRVDRIRKEDWYPYLSDR